MNRIFFALMLMLTAASTSAVESSEQESATLEPTDYCLGFVAGGLASDQLSGMSRTELWLAWNYVIRSGALEPGETGSEYKTGLAQFQNAADAAAAHSMLQEADGECGLGRTGFQITGW
jgi:hypothetical protein